MMQVYTFLPSAQATYTKFYRKIVRSNLAKCSDPRVASFNAQKQKC